MGSQNTTIMIQRNCIFACIDISKKFLIALRG